MSRLFLCVVVLACLPISGCTPGSFLLSEKFTAQAPRPGETRIAFGSCIRIERPVPILDEIIAVDPDVMVLLGDNVYVDRPARVKSAEDFGRKYRRLSAQPYWQRFRGAVPLLATWDDHDYGRNDGGENWRYKDAAKSAFLSFFGLPADSPVRERGGIYSAEILGQPGRRVQVILLDTRWFRDRLSKKVAGLWGKGGPYKPTTDTQRTLLGEEQWAWLEQKLREPAEARVIVSSIQVLGYGHGWETWANFPHEQQRLFDLIAYTEAAGVVMISGDRHLGEISYLDTDALAYPLWDITSSGLNQRPKTHRDPNPLRVGPSQRVANFGLLRIDWSATDPAVTFELHGLGGEVFNRRGTTLSALQPEDKSVSLDRDRAAIHE